MVLHHVLDRKIFKEYRAIAFPSTGAATNSHDSRSGKTSRTTLGVAHYRAGDWKEAIAALDDSVAMGKRGDAFDWFFLAMAHWQRHDQDEARKTYKQAVEWMEKNQPQNEELQQFRTEATELLGISEVNSKTDAK